MKIAVVGVGYLGQHHARVFSELEDVKLSCVVDIRRERAEEIASKFHTKAFFDYRDILKRVDALSIATPTPTHYEIALNAIKAGKDVFIEKPITATVEEADELIEEAEKRGAIVQVGHIERYNPALRRLFKFVNSPHYLESERLSPFLGRCSDVDVTIDLMVHDIDIVLKIVKSEIKSIMAKGISVKTPLIDAASAWIEFENGASAFFRANRVYYDKVRVLRVYEEVSGFQRFTEVNYKEGKLRIVSGDMEEMVKTESVEPLKEELKDFVKSVITRTPPEVTGLQAREALKVAFDISSIIRKGWN